MQTSILGSLKKDFFLLYAPGLSVALILICKDFIGLHTTETASMIFLFILYYQMDTGHNCITGLRVFRKWDYETAIFLLLIPNMFFLNWLFAYTLPVLFFRVHFYWGFFHHLRQYWGLCAWYQKINGRYDAPSKIFCHILPIFPFLNYHFHPAARNLGFVHDQREVILYPSVSVFNTVFFLFLLTVFIWLCFEYRNYKKFGFEANRVLSIFCPTLMHGVSFYLGKSILTFLAPMIVGHAIAYVCLMDLGLNKLSTNFNRTRSFIKMGCVAFAGGVFICSVDYFFESPSADNFGPLVYSFLMALATLPAFWHRIVDSHIWKGNHAEAKIIYAS